MTKSEKDGLSMSTTKKTAEARVPYFEEIPNIEQFVRKDEWGLRRGSKQGCLLLMEI